MNLLRKTMMGIAVVFVTAAVPAVADEADDETLEPAVSRETLASMASSATEGNNAATTIEDAAAGQAEQSGGVMDEIVLERTEITGNQELPKMLYIVPWQKSEVGDLVGKPVSTALEDVLAPIDRSEFIRQVDYHGETIRDSGED